MLPTFLLNRPFVPLTTERLTLRPLKAEDALGLATLANDHRVAEKFARIPHPYRLEDAKSFIQWAQEKMHTGKSVILAVIRRFDETFLGIVSLEEELGYWIGVPFWEQGYGKEAVAALVRFYFIDLKREEDLKGSSLIDNAPSCRILEGLGFKETGTRETSSHGYEGVKLAKTYVLSLNQFIEKQQKRELPLLWAVGGILINEKGRLLLTQRLPEKAYPGVWEVPGGKMEEGETPEQALVRELQEELDIQVVEQNLTPLTFISYSYETFHLVMPLYLCEDWVGVPRGAEGQTLKWVIYSDFSDFPSLPASILPIHRVAEFLKSLGVWGTL